VPAAAVSTIERRLAAITTHYRSAGAPLDRGDRHIIDLMAGIRRSHGRPPKQKEAVLGDDILAMVATLSNDLRGWRDRAILLLGFAGGLRRSEIVGLDCAPGQTEDGGGWAEILPGGVLLIIRGKTGWRTVEVARGSTERTCPVAALETWLKLARIAHGPIFRRMFEPNGGIGAERLSDKHVARLVKWTALAAGVRGDLPEGERGLAFAGHSLRAGLATAADVEEALVQRQLGHASPEMTRGYKRRRERFKVNLTKAPGL
jgi:integrase